MVLAVQASAAILAWMIAVLQSSINTAVYAILYFYVLADIAASHAAVQKEDKKKKPILSSFAAQVQREALVSFCLLPHQGSASLAISPQPRKKFRS